MKPMTNKNLYKFRSFAGFPVGAFFLILVLSSAATGRNARAEKISSVTFRNAVGALKNPIPAAFRGFQLCSFYPTLNNNAAICTPNNPFTNPYWGVGRAPLGLTSNGIVSGLDGVAGAGSGSFTVVIADAGFSGFNDFPDSPTTSGNPTSITVAASCVHVQQDDIGAKLAVVRGVTVVSTDPLVVVGTPILALYGQDEDGNDSQAATFAVSGTGCSLADAQNAQYLSPPFPAGLSDNLQTLLEPIMSGNITAK